MAYQPSVRLLLNNIRFPQWNSITLKQTLNALTGITINMPNPAGIRTTLPFEDLPIKFYLGWDTNDPPLRFDGYHDDPSFSVNKSGAMVTMTGRDFGRILFDEMTVDDDFNSYGNPIGEGYVLDYLEYLNGNLSSPLPELFERNTVDDANNAFQYDFQNQKCLEALTKLCGYGNYEWKMLLDQDNNRQFSIRKPLALTDANATHAFIVGERSNYTDIPPAADVHHVEAITVRKQFGYKKNYIKVKGEEVEAVYPLSPPSSPKHLLHEDSGILNVTDAQAVAARLWSERSAAKILVDFSGVGVETLRVGDIVYVNDYRYGASTLPTHLFRIIEINDNITFGGGWKSSFRVADFVPSLFQFFDGTEGL